MFDSVIITNIQDIFGYNMFEDQTLIYLGISFVSFIVSILVFVPVPSFPIVVVATLDSRLDPNLIAISSTIGVSAAKLIIFYAIYYGHNFFIRRRARSNTKNKLLSLERLARKYGWKAALIAAMTPIPDDIVYISLALAKYSPWKFIVSSFAGKFIINEIVVWSAVYLGKPFIDRFVSGIALDPLHILISVTISVSILAIAIYIFLKVDMDKMIRKYFPKAFEDE